MFGDLIYMDNTERFEKLAKEFYQKTGMMAPGKDQSAAVNIKFDYGERDLAWQNFLKLVELADIKGESKIKAK